MRPPRPLGSLLSLVAVLILAPRDGIAQQNQHRVAHEAKLQTEEDTANRVLTVRLGPLDLPAGSTHENVTQPPELYLVVPFDGWLRAYHPQLIDAEGGPIPGRLLHHVAFWNTERSDFLCPNKEEHIFGAGGEMNDWMAVPGVGYRVAKGDRIRITAMFHNPTATDHPGAYLQVKVDYRPLTRGEAAALKNVYPVWFDVQECGRSDYDLEPGSNVTVGEITLPFAGKLLGVGGHLHDYGTELRLENVTRGEEIAVLTPETDAKGRILSMPIVPFFMQGGYPLQARDIVRVTAHYDNRSGTRLDDGAMGIVVGYFVPNDGRRMEELRRSSDLQRR